MAQQDPPAAAGGHVPDVPALLHDLGSGEAGRRAEARARLANLGSRAVPPLVEALDGASARIRANVMSILSLIRDPRAREPIIAQLLDRDPKVREAAVRALSRLPCRAGVHALKRSLRTDPRQEVRLASLQSLISLFEAGFDDGLEEILAVLFDSSADRRLRHAALAVLPVLRPKESRAILKKLRSDPDEEMARLAGQIEHAPERPEGPDGADMRKALSDLASPRPDCWNEALQELTSLGPQVVGPLVFEMVRRSRDPEYCLRAGMVLRGLGPRRARSIADYLERVDDPLPLEVIVEAVGCLEDKPLIYRLKDLIDRLRERARAGASEEPVEELDRVRAKAHLQLARIGSRVAIDDLRERVSAPGRRVDIELIAALELIGKKEELIDLLRAYRHEEPWVRDRIREVFLRIMRRERLRRTNRIFASLASEELRTLQQILGPPRRRQRRSQAALAR